MFTRVCHAGLGRTKRSISSGGLWQEWAQARDREQGGRRILLQKVPETAVGKERDVQ